MECQVVRGIRRGIVPCSPKMASGGRSPCSKPRLLSSLLAFLGTRLHPPCFSALKSWKTLSRYSGLAWTIQPHPDEMHEPTWLRRVGSLEQCQPQARRAMPVGREEFG
jgi:hypothetical protein